MNDSEKTIGELRDEMIGQFRMEGELSEEEMWMQIHHRVLELGNTLHLGIGEKNRLAEEVFNSLRRLGILQELVDDAGISEIMINGPKNIFIERNGELNRWEKQFERKEDLENIIQQIVAKTNRRVNETNPVVDARLENGSRVNIVLPPVALDGPVVTIRRFPENPYTMQDLVAKDTLSQEVAWFLRGLVTAGYNIFISGGTGSGKTTFLNALSGYIPKTERIITIEDSAELNIKSIPNLVRMETRNANADGENEITIRDLIRTALRMRPDRVIVGEVRGAEAIDMLSSMNTGHDGSLSTGHSNSCRDMLKRLETMILTGGVEIPLAAIRGQIASGIDVMIHVGRLRDRSRKVLSVEEITGIEGGEIRLHTLFRFEEKEEVKGVIHGEWIKAGELIHQEKLRNRGLA